MTHANPIDLRLHAIVEDLDVAEHAVRNGATVVQLRLKHIPTEEVVRRGHGFSTLRALFVVNDDVDAALALSADGVHLGLEDDGVEQALSAGLVVGLSVSTPAHARAAERLGAAYIGCGPVWRTPTKPDAGPPIGVDGLHAVCVATHLPVIGIGGINATNAAECIAAGAAGVAVVRAASDVRALRVAVDSALRCRSADQS